MHPEPPNIFPNMVLGTGWMVCSGGLCWDIRRDDADPAKSLTNQAFVPTDSCLPGFFGTNSSTYLI